MRLIIILALALSFLSVDQFELFSSRVKHILDWNSESHSYKKGINRFTDMTDDERKKFVMPERNAKESRVSEQLHSLFLLP